MRDVCRDVSSRCILAMYPLIHSSHTLLSYTACAMYPRTHPTNVRV
jgi:hypothetical protein